MTTDTDRAYRAAQAVRDLIRERRGDDTCTCGADYQPTPDGIRQHRTLHGHTPSGGAR